MTMIDILMQNPQIKHGTIAIAFTPDEEVGGGIEKFDIKALGPLRVHRRRRDLGEISDETGALARPPSPFMARVRIREPPRAHDQCDVRAGRLHFALPHDMLPETTEGRVGFVHPYAGTIDVEDSNLKILLRDFDQRGSDKGKTPARDGERQSRSIPK